MAKQIIVLGKQSQDIWDNFTLVMWFPITSGQQTRANGSAWSQASTAENTAIESGSVLEEEINVTVPVGLSVANPTAVQAWFQQIWTNRAAQLNSVGPAQFANVFNDPAAGGWQAATPQTA